MKFSAAVLGIVKQRYLETEIFLNRDYKINSRLPQN
jgi:hypothetical protein